MIVRTALEGLIAFPRDGKRLHRAMEKLMSIRTYFADQKCTMHDELRVAGTGVGIDKCHSQLLIITGPILLPAFIATIINLRAEIIAMMSEIFAVADMDRPILRGAAELRAFRWNRGRISA